MSRAMAENTHYVQNPAKAKAPVKHNGEVETGRQTPGARSEASGPPSQNRVREWINMTEDVTSSAGDSHTNESVMTSETEIGFDEDEALWNSPYLRQEAWDRFQMVSRDEQWRTTGFSSFLRCFKLIWMGLLFLSVLAAGVANKISLLTLTTSVLKGRGGPDPRPTMLLLAVSFPYVCHFLAYTVRSAFGSAGWPSLRLMLVVLTLEVGHSIGLGLLIFRVLPRVDMLRALVLLTSVYSVPSFLYVITSVISKVTSKMKRVGMMSAAFTAFVLQIAGVVFAIYQCFVYSDKEAIELKLQTLVAQDVSTVQRSAPVVAENIFFELPFALVLISLGFWENFLDGEFTLCGRTFSISSWRAHLQLVRQRVYLVVAFCKISVSVLMAVALLPDFTFTLTFPDLAATLTPNGTSITSEAVEHWDHYGPLYLMLVSSLLCSYLSGLACKLCMQITGFAVPLSLVTPASAAVVVLECRYNLLYLHGPSYAWVCPEPSTNDLPWQTYLLVLLGVVWLSQQLLTWHIWRPSSGRMEKIDNLFITPMRCAVFTEQTLLAKRRIRSYNSRDQSWDKESSAHDDGYKCDKAPLIYACATMWHETRHEMTQLLKSIFRMDVDRSARFIAQKFYNVRDPEYYDFEAHIFFDDAFTVAPDGAHIPNEYVGNFMDCVDDALSSVHERSTSLGDPVRTPTPYGGRLTWVLPGGTALVAHLKDKQKARHKKRWSQVMYIYYLLGYRILANSEAARLDETNDIDSASDVGKPDGEGGGIMGGDPVKLSTSQLRRRRRTTFFSRSAIFNYVSREVQAQAENTYVLALDGDVDFKPEAVRLLLDRMKKNKKVGAACGRIHPIGSGPIVWYQKFEYAIGHWLQKATEHVFGCVLCAPGCFSLFRGSALMDDNVARTYALRATQAGHYIQFDQGEDRWLSTLLLQQGYRIDYCAASDALTHAPESFAEFFNQRRRWGPSTLANLIDLIGDWRTSVRLNDNLSSIYMFYQAMMLVSAILGPATVVLLMAGSFRLVFKITVVQSYVLTLLGPIIYLVLCIYTKPSLQLTAGAVLSAVYALVMTIVLVGTVGTAITGSITSPNVIFLSTIIVIFLVSAALHPQELYCLIPGILYLILIPAGYLVLTIYFLTNLHVVSWGTRESQQSVKVDEEKDKNKKENPEEGQRKGGLLGWFGMHTLVHELRQLFNQVQDMVFHTVKKTSKPKASRTEQLLEELIVEMREKKKAEENRSESEERRSQPEEGEQSVVGAQDVEIADGYQETDVDSTQEVISTTRDGDDLAEANDNENGSQADLDVPPRTDQWLDTIICGEGPVTKLSARELTFWAQVIHKYLYPLPDDRAHLEKINTDLRTLRNNVVFGFFMISALWVALTMQLEVLQNDLEDFVFFQIPRFGGGPTLKFQPLGLFFLATFGIILLIQFVGMFAHRWGTMLHTLAITQLGIGRHEKEHKKVRDIIMRVSELQKLRYIELEPEPDYDEPLADYDNDDGSPAHVTDHVVHFADEIYGQPSGRDFPAAERMSHVTPTSSTPYTYHNHDGRPLQDMLVGYPGQSHTSRPGHGQNLDQGQGHSDIYPARDPGPYGVKVNPLRMPPSNPRLQSRPLGDFTLQRAFVKRYRNELQRGQWSNMDGSTEFYSHSVYGGNQSTFDGI